MGSRAAGLLGHIDAEVLGKTMLDAALRAGIGVTVTYVDGPEPRNAYISETAATILGRPVEELMAMDPLDLVSKKDRARIAERLGRRQAGEVGQTSYELLVAHKDGTEVPIELTASQASMGGRRVVFAFLTDIRARKEAEEQRRKNDERFRDLIDAAPELIGIIRDGHFVYANRAFAAALGFEDDGALCAVEVTTLLDPDDIPVQRARESALLEHGLPQPPHVYRARRRDGTLVLLETSSVPFDYEGRPAALTMARDVTQKKRLELQLMQADRLAALGTMAAGVAHEINNPLAYVMLNLEWVARKLPDIQKDPSSLPGLLVMLEEAREGAQRVSLIVRELRSFSRADGETRKHVDVAGVVMSAIRIVGNEIRHRASIVTSFDAVRPVLANDSRLEQVVVNLLLNAAQAMPERATVKNEIRVSVREDAEHRAVLEVSDNGSGIPNDILPRIFDPFFTTKPVGVGTGLGLSICHGIVTALGGHIAAYSDPTDGTTFRVVLPTTDVLSGGSPGAAIEPYPPRDMKRARVLVVDDEPAIANTLRELLTPVHEVSCAIGAREALAILQVEEFDVIFCDLMMPSMSGIELFERIKAERPGLERRVVFMTGGAFTARAAEFLSSVSNRRVEKPFSLGLVEQIVRDVAVKPTGAGQT